MPSQLPLFPLRIVLFPGALLPLHIFENRYRRLLADISAGDPRFVILPPGPDGGMPAPGAVGCVARLRGVSPLGDGRSNIVVSGEERVRFISPASALTEYDQGVVEALPDDATMQVPGNEDVMRLRALGERYALALQTLRNEVLDLHFSPDAAALSFEVAALLDWEFEPRQRLLESRSALERVARLLHVLPALVQSTEDRAIVHDRAKGNGHGVLH